MVFGYNLYSPNPGSPAAHLAAPISAIDVEMTLDDASDQLSAPGEFTIGTGENSECITYTSLVGNVVSGMSRGQGGTTAAPWGIGTEVKRGFTAYDMFAILERIVGGAADGVAGPASSVDNHLAVFDGAGGHIIKDGGLKPMVTTDVPLMNGTAAIGSSGKWADGLHIHPVDTSRAAAADLAAKAPLASPALTGTPTAPTAAAGTNTTQIATTAFVQNLISYIDSLTYKGVIDCSANPNYPAADAGDVYVISASGKIGGASGKTATVSDMLICNHDGSPSGDEAAVGTYWNLITVNTGAIIGPASSTDGHLVAFDGPSGKLVKDGGAIPVVPAFETDPTNIKMNGTQAVGSSGLTPNSDHVHPVDTSRAPVADPTFTGTVTTPAVKITGGTPGLGKVLTSDADGDGTWQDAAQRTRLTANTTYYVATTGNDTTGTGASGTPWATIQHAYDWICAHLDLSGYTATIQIADGTYSAGLSAAGPWTGGGAVTVQGNTSDMDSVVISGATNPFVISCTLPGILTLKYFKITSTTGDHINHKGTGSINIANLNFGSASGIHILVGSTGATISAYGAAYTISAGGYSHIYVIAGYVNLGWSTVTVSNTPAFTAFVFAGGCGVVIFSSATITGSATGSRYSVTTNSVCSSGGITLPGDSAGTTSTGGQYT